jgi:hypothetical protein
MTGIVVCNPRSHVSRVALLCMEVLLASIPANATGAACVDVYLHHGVESASGARDGDACDRGVIGALETLGALLPVPALLAVIGFEAWLTYDRITTECGVEIVNCFVTLAWSGPFPHLGPTCLA